MPYLPAVLGSPLKAKLVERLLRGGPAGIGQLAEDVDASRQGVSQAVAELELLGVLSEAPAADRRAKLVAVNPQYPFLEALRILAVDGAAWHETPEAWQELLATRYGRDWYVGGYAALRRVLQPIDFEDPRVLLNVADPDAPDVAGALERATGARFTMRRVPAIPPEVVPVQRGAREVWFATPERGFVEAWRVKEIPLYGLMLCLVQGLHDGALDAGKLLAVAPSERMEQEVRTLLAAVAQRLPLPGLDAPPRPARALKPPEKKALDAAFGTVVG